MILLVRASAIVSMVVVVELHAVDSVMPSAVSLATICVVGIELEMDHPGSIRWGLGCNCRPQGTQLPQNGVVRVSNYRGT